MAFVFVLVLVADIGGVVVIMTWPVLVCPASWPVDLSSFLPSSREGLYPKGTVIVLKHLAVVRHHDALFPPPQQIVRNPAAHVDGREREINI